MTVGELIMDKKDPWARQNEAYHDKIATSYEMSIRPSTLPAFIFYYKKHLKFISKLDKNIKFLDIGAGTGDFCSDLLSWGFKDITANDISGNMLEEIIKRYPTIEINQGDATALSIEH
jgi:ubiquinone/menaquinone biosynthesis C-methylase UbiE